MYIPLSENTVVWNNPTIIQVCTLFVDTWTERKIVQILTTTVHWEPILSARSFLLKLLGKITAALAIVGIGTTSRLLVGSNTVGSARTMDIVASH